MLVVLWCTYMCVFTIIYEYTCLCVVLMYTSIHTHKNMERICCYRIHGAKTKGLKTSQDLNPHFRHIFKSLTSRADHCASQVIIEVTNTCHHAGATGADRRLPKPFPGLVVGCCFIFSRQTAFPFLAVSPLGDQPRTCHSPAPGCCTAAAQPWSVNHQLPLHSLIKRHLTNISLTRRKACWSSSSWSQFEQHHHWSIRREI